MTWTYIVLISFQIWIYRAIQVEYVCEIIRTFKNKYVRVIKVKGKFLIKEILWMFVTWIKTE